MFKREMYPCHFIRHIINILEKYLHHEDFRMFFFSVKENHIELAWCRTLKLTEMWFEGTDK